MCLFFRGKSNLPDGWDIHEINTGGFSQGTGYESDYSVYINATSEDRYLTQAYIPIRTNRDYSISCYAKRGPVGNSTGITISLQIIDQFGIPGDEIITASYSGISGWQHLSDQGMLSSDFDEIVQVRVKLQVASGSSAYFDDVVVEEL